MTMSHSRVELLKCMSIFHGLREDTLRVLLDRANIACVPTGEFFFRQGDDALYMYVLESGEVSIEKSWQDRDVNLGKLGPGDCFGEMALIDLASRSASIVALSPCIAIEISAVHLHSVHDFDIEQFIVIQANIARELCRRLRVADEIRMLSVPARDEFTDSQLAWPQILAL
jgi:CRP-like cAMP-binding protein